MAVPFLKLQSSHWPMSCNNKQKLTKVRYESQGIKNSSKHNRAHHQDKTQHLCLHLLADALLLYWFHQLLQAYFHKIQGSTT